MASAGWRLVLTKCRYEPSIIPILLAALRIAICFWPQTGYLHPDEFFQSTDITGGHFFKSQVQPVWEFSTDKPIRCMLIPHLLNTIAFKLVAAFSRTPTAYQLLVAPRLVYALASFIIDACLYKLCQYHSSRGLWYLPVSIVFQSSFVCLGCLTRTLSNVPESIIFALLLVVVSQLIRPRFRILFVTPTRSTPAHERIRASTQLTSSLLVGFLVTLGTFNRPTFPCFALVPLLYWLNESFKRNAYSARLNIKRVLVPVSLAALLTGLLLSAFDTFYYHGREQTLETLAGLYASASSFDIAQLGRLAATRWIVTPYNFILYNTNVDNLARYGLHSPYMHMLVNLPFAFNVLALMFYGKLISLLLGSGVYRLLFSTHRIYALMLLSVLTSTILLSFIPHQEFRFLLPLIVPLVYAFAYNIYSSNSCLLAWLLLNACLTYFYGAVHQAGPIRASLDLEPRLKSFLAQSESHNRTLVDVTAFRCFLGPTYHLGLPAAERRFRLHLQDTIEEVSESFSERLGESLERRSQFGLNEFANKNNHDDQLEDWQRSPYEHKFYFMLPSLYVNQLDAFMQTHYPGNLTKLRVIKQYAPIFSHEDLGVSFAHIRAAGWRAWRDAFGFSLCESDLIAADKRRQQTRAVRRHKVRHLEGDGDEDEDHDDDDEDGANGRAAHHDRRPARPGEAGTRANSA